MTYHSGCGGGQFGDSMPPHSLIVRDIGHIDGYSLFKHLFEYGVNYHDVNLCRIIDIFAKTIYNSI